MGLGHLTKQLAQQAIGNQVKDVVDSLRPEESAASAETRPPSDLGSVILAQLHAMQKALKEDEELVVTCTAGGQAIRVFEVYLPAPGVAVLSGIDNERNTARLIAAVDTLQLVCKPRPVPPPGKATRVRLVTPKP